MTTTQTITICNATTAALPQDNQFGFFANPVDFNLVLKIAGQIEKEAAEQQESDSESDSESESESKSEGEEMDCDAPRDDKDDEVAMPGVSRDAVACGSPASEGTTAVNSRPFCTKRCKKCSNCVCHKSHANMTCVNRD